MEHNISIDGDVPTKAAPALTSPDRPQMRILNAPQQLQRYVDKLIMDLLLAPDGAEHEHAVVSG